MGQWNLKHRCRIRLQSPRREIPRKTTQHDIKKISEEVRKQQDRDELDQIDRQNTVRNERDDPSAPANLEQM